MLIFEGKRQIAAKKVAGAKIRCLDEDGPFLLELLNHNGSKWFCLEQNPQEYLEFSNVHDAYLFLRESLLWSNEIIISSLLD